MTCGVPVDEVIARQVREMVERAAGAQVIAAIRESHRQNHEIVAQMSDEEFANWIMSEA